LGTEEGLGTGRSPQISFVSIEPYFSYIHHEISAYTPFSLSSPMRFSLFDLIRGLMIVAICMHPLFIYFSKLT